MEYFYDDNFYLQDVIISHIHTYPALIYESYLE